MDSVSGAQSSQKTKITLSNIFKSIISSDREIETSVDQMNNIINNDLKLNLDNLDEDQIATLPYMLMRFIKNWPGWSKKQEFDDGILGLEAWKARFRKYICYKMQLLVTKTLPSLETDEPESSSSNSENCIDMGTQSDCKGNFANFSIDVSGPAFLLNNIVFSGHKDNIRVEQHAEKPWVELKTEEILNYPFVEVEFISSELSFKRSFEPKVSLSISSSSDFVTEKSDFILGRSTINAKCPKWPIRLNVLEIYIRALKKAVFSHYPLYSGEKEEFSAVLDQFYNDLIDIGSKKSVFENRRTTFNIGGCIFKRNKKIKHGSSSTDVLFNEMYLPRVVSSFRYFTGMQHDGVKRIAANRKYIDREAMLAFRPRISYKCTYCKITFEDSNALSNLAEHLEEQHRRAQTLVCIECNKCIEVAELSRRRWKCPCIDKS